MSIKSGTFYWVECDCCGSPSGDIDGRIMLLDSGDTATEAAVFNGWIFADHELLCESCWTWPERLPDYPGDEAYTGPDAPVRRHAVHPRSES